MAIHGRLSSALAAGAAAASMLLAAPAPRTANVVLITTDGLRPEEVFAGADESLLTKEAGVADVPELKREFGRDTAAARRQALLPFLWTAIARQGQIYGNASRGSEAHTPRRTSRPAPVPQSETAVSQADGAA